MDNLSSEYLYMVHLCVFFFFKGSNLLSNGKTKQLLCYDFVNLY